MNTATHAVRQALDVAWLLAQAGARNLVGHWALAIFSVVIAFGTWFIIQDVENPRIEGIVPPDGEQQIRVEYVNSSDDVTVVDAAFVRVRVEAREDRITELRASDFRAVVDLQGLQASDEVLDLPVRVTPSDGDVRVIEVQPATVPVELVTVEEREFEVQVRQVDGGPLPGGYEFDEPPVISPQFVTVRGTPDLVANVDRVEIDVNFTGRRADFEVTGDLVARNANGQAQTVTLSTRQATVSFSVAQIIQQREFPVRPVLTGTLADGYRVAAVQLNPRIIRVNASDDVLDSITDIVLEPMDVQGASNDVTRTVQVRAISNAILTPEQVEVTVVVEPIECDELDGSTPCATSVALVAPTFSSLPTGLSLSPGIYTVRIDLIGSPSALAALRTADISASVSLSGLTAGTHQLTPQVVAPQGITVLSVGQVSVTLASAP